MPKTKPESCVQSAKGPISPKKNRPEAQPTTPEEAGGTMHVMVGTEAPDFEASAFVGKGFKNIKLSDFRGKWVFLCFYPGDFTFV